MKVDLALNWNQSDIDYIKTQRKFWANREILETEKQWKKHSQRYVKAATLVLEYITGYKGGKVDGELIVNPIFPSELETYINSIFVFTQTDHSIGYSDVYRSTETTEKNTIFD